MKKLIINESQLRLIKNLLLENKTQDLIKKVNIGDIILIYRENVEKHLIFEVINNLPDGVFMRPADTNSKDRDKLIRFNIMDLDGDTLNLKWIDSPEGEKVGKPSWKNVTVKNITGYSLLDSDKNPKGFVKLSDEEEEEVNTDNSVEDDDNIEDNQSESEYLKTLISSLDEIEVGSKHILTLSDNSKIHFEVIDKVPNKIGIKILKNVGKEAKRYDKLIDNILELEPSSKTVKLVNGKKIFNISFLSYPDDRDINEVDEDDVDVGEPVVISNIINFEKSYIDASTDVSSYATITDKEAMSMILKNPKIRGAFMKQPTLWDMITNSEPKGLIKAKSILDKVYNGDNESNKQVTDVLKIPNKISFKLLGDSFSEEIDGVTYKLNNEVKYIAKNRAKRDGGVFSTILTKGGMELFIYRIKNKDNEEYLARIIINSDSGKDFKENRVIKIFKQQ